MPLLDGWYKRYNSLRLLGYDYSSPNRPLFVTLDAKGMFSVFAELVFAKRLIRESARIYANRAEASRTQATGLGVVADFNNQVPESNETNNTAEFPIRIQ